MVFVRVAPSQEMVGQNCFSLRSGILREFDLDQEKIDVLKRSQGKQSFGRKNWKEETFQVILAMFFSYNEQCKLSNPLLAVIKWVEKTAVIGGRRPRLYFRFVWSGKFMFYQKFMFCLTIIQVQSFATEMDGLSKTVESEIQEQKRWDWTLLYSDETCLTSFWFEHLCAAASACFFLLLFLSTPPPRPCLRMYKLFSD